LEEYRLMDEEAPSPAADDRATLERETDITFFVASGPGGQHRNRNATGVRLLHRPSGIVVTATERRSQAANREIAFERLAARLEAARAVPTPRVATRPSRTARTARREQKRRTGIQKQLRKHVRDE
jgi:protein subunit release factor A